MSENPIAAHGRMHALDGLRASMLLLGLVIHSSVSYTVMSPGDAWPYDDPATTLVADFGVYYIHVFRMPIFFVLAGFFTALLCVRRGVAGMLNNRLQRIGWPFIVALLLLYPLVVGGFTFANAAKAGSIGSAWAAVGALARTPALYLPDSTMHLWFIYYLLYFYAIAVLMAQACGRLPRAWQQGLQAGFHRLVASPVARIALPAVVTAGTLLPMGGVLQTRTVFAPDPAVFLAYFVFFGFGWLLYREHQAVAQFARGAWSLSIGATVLYLAFESLLMPSLRASGSTFAAAVVQSLLNGFVTWMLFYGFTGLFVRYLNQPSRAVRYIVDGSYWVYLIHLPITIWIPGLLVGTGLSVWSRMAIVFTLTAVFGFATYELLVRSTWIGRVLNGRRYARGLPAAAGTAPAAQRI